MHYINPLKDPIISAHECTLCSVEHSFSIFNDTSDNDEVIDQIMTCLALSKQKTTLNQCNFNRNNTSSGVGCITQIQNTKLQCLLTTLLQFSVLHDRV